MHTYNRLGIEHGCNMWWMFVTMTHHYNIEVLYTFMTTHAIELWFESKET